MEPETVSAFLGSPITLLTWSALTTDQFPCLCGMREEGRDRGAYDVAFPHLILEPFETDPD